MSTKPAPAAEYASDARGMTLLAHGCLPLEDRWRVRRDVLREIVIPCGRALVSQSVGATHAA